MIVKDLIEKLQEFDENFEVILITPKGIASSADSVIKSGIADPLTFDSADIVAITGK